MGVFYASKIYRDSKLNIFLARLKMFPKRLFGGQKAFKSYHVSPKKTPIRLKSLRKPQALVAILQFWSNPLVQHLAWGRLLPIGGFCWPDLVGRNLSDLHTLWSRKNFSSGCEPCSTQGFCVLFDMS